MPAAAVIPAPIAYTKVVAVKKLVVGFLDLSTCPLRKESEQVLMSIIEDNVLGIYLFGTGSSSFTVSKLECSKQAYAVEYISME